MRDDMLCDGISTETQRKDEHIYVWWIIAQSFDYYRLPYLIESPAVSDDMFSFDDMIHRSLTPPIRPSVCIVYSK